VSDRLRAALESLVLSAVPELRFLGTWEYVVQVATPGPPVTVSGKPVDPIMPPLSSIVVRPDSGGGYAVPLSGQKVLVRFANPFTPSLRTAYVEAMDPGGIPLNTTLDASVAVAIGKTSPVTNIGALPLPVATSAGTLAALLAIEVWVAFLQTQWLAGLSGTALAATMATPTATLVTALTTTATVAVPTKTTNAT
jgi:hypothetical protein